MTGTPFGTRKNFENSHSLSQFHFYKQNRRNYSRCFGIWFCIFFPPSIFINFELWYRFICILIQWNYLFTSNKSIDKYFRWNAPCPHLFTIFGIHEMPIATWIDYSIVKFSLPNGKKIQKKTNSIKVLTRN